MKKILSKIFKRKKEPLPTRITSDTVAEHRERILAGGRRFKYPIQYARHKLVINAILISLIALILVVVVGWWRLYVVQSTSDFIYSITKVIPVPVASVDGQSVLYSDYLMKYLSSIHYLVNKEQLNLNSADGKRQVTYVKQQSMNDAIADAYAIKLAGEKGISVSDSELELFLVLQRQSNGTEITEQAYQAVVLDYYGWSPSEYRHVTKNKLLRQKVAYSMDKDALTLSNGLSEILQADSSKDFKTLAEATPARGSAKAVYGVSGWVPKSNQDGGLTTEAAKLEKSQMSSVIKSSIGDGYYIVKLIDISDDQVSYEYIKVPLTAFDNMLQSAKDKNKIDKYINI